MASAVFDAPAAAALLAALSGARGSIDGKVGPWSAHPTCMYVCIYLYIYLFIVFP